MPWVLAAGFGVDGWEAAPTSATFGDEAVSGFTGCNRFTAPFTVEGNSLDIGSIASTRMAGPPPADAVERAYLDALGRVARWRSEGANLVLLDGEEEELLRCETATLLGNWKATAIPNGL